MHYYDPDNKTPRRWATIAAAAYGVLLVGSFALVSFDFTPALEKPGDTILVDFTEPPVVEPPRRPVRVANEPRVHDVVDPVEQTAQVSGKDDATQTPNPKALFKMSKSGADEPENAGNPRAPEGEEKASGTGPGLNPDGLDQLDQGLKGRGLVGNLPKPDYPGNKTGKIVIRVTVDASGRVTGASFEPKGSTESDPQLVSAALEAARKARFTESRAAVQGGTITYVFRME
ncbi:MAG TPA: TonB family protein [Candidatus Alistipes faecavium]|uniref:energy transducer TonB family protein n=1 Tax=uncultured Alistipes sp. TaxID=538949 RepID=UPI001F867591|nr:energy transducer TonB [uncultured Alistipes sp.]HJA97011.1 TonB family protein [Candidatus Alistipes faecavium]